MGDLQAARCQAVGEGRGKGEWKASSFGSTAAGTNPEARLPGWWKGSAMVRVGLLPQAGSCGISSRGRRIVRDRADRHRLADEAEVLFPTFQRLMDIRPGSLRGLARALQHRGMSFPVAGTAGFSGTSVHTGKTTTGRAQGIRPANCPQPAAGERASVRRSHRRTSLPSLNNGGPLGRLPARTQTEKPERRSGVLNLPFCGGART